MESLLDLGDWHQDVMAIIEDTAPESTPMLQCAESMTTFIGVQMVAQKPDVQTAGPLNQQLFALLANLLDKDGAAIASQRTGVGTRCGLEAWRRVWQFIAERNGKPLYVEHQQLTIMVQVH